MIKECKIYPVHKCFKEDSIIDIAKTMKNKNERHIFVVDEYHRPLGIISTTDIAIKIVADGRAPKKMKAKDIMNSPVQSVDINQDAADALKIIIEKNTLTCPVTENKALMGIVYYGDVLNKVSSKIKEQLFK